MPETTERQQQQAPATQRPRTLAEVLALRGTWTLGFTALTIALIVFLIVGALLFPSPKGQGYAGSADITLTSISMVSPDEGWAAGSISGSPQAILMRYQHGAWTIIAKPAGLGLRAGIIQVDMLSATDGWALSSVEIPANDGQGTTTPGGVILHYNGTAWIIATPQARAPLLHISMDSATDGWIVGQNGLLLHYDGRAWNEVHDSGFASLGAVTLIDALSPRDVWVNAGNGLAHFDGNHWSRAPIQDAAHGPGAPVTALAMASDREGWAIAGTQIFYDDNGYWRAMSSPRSPAPVALAIPAAGEVWAVGSPDNILMRYQHGQWWTVKPPINETLAAMTFITPTEGWAVGISGTILHYQNGSWIRDTNVSWDKAAYSAWTGQ